MRAKLAAANILAIAVGVPAVLYFHIFRMEPGKAPGGRTVLVALLVIVWAILALRPFPTPNGPPWRYPVRAAVLVGGNVLTALAMFLLLR